MASHIRLNNPSKNIKGMNILLHSTIPIAAGLASSSALVVVSAIAALFINNLHQSLSLE